MTRFATLQKSVRFGGTCAGLTLVEVLAATVLLTLIAVAAMRFIRDAATCLSNPARDDPESFRELACFADRALADDPKARKLLSSRGFRGPTTLPRVAEDGKRGAAAQSGADRAHRFTESRRDVEAMRWNPLSRPEEDGSAAERGNEVAEHAWVRFQDGDAVVWRFVKLSPPLDRRRPFQELMDHEGSER